MNMDCIKWLVSYADRFEYFEHDETIEYSDLWGCYISDLEDGLHKDIIRQWELIYRPLLLQRAIEGINKAGEYLITTTHDSIFVKSKSYTGHSEKTGTWFNQSINEAKDYICKYIYKQETGND